MHQKVSFIQRCPLFRVSFIRGSTVQYDDVLDAPPTTELMIETEFLTMANSSLGETWSARIRGKPLSQRPVLSSLIVYLYNEGRGQMAYHLSGQRSLEEVYGHTPEVYFTVCG